MIHISAIIQFYKPNTVITIPILQVSPYISQYMNTTINHFNSTYEPIYGKEIFSRNVLNLIHNTKSKCNL